jgi:futalosine hydrolase
VPPRELGFPQWPGEPGAAARGIDPLYDRIALALPEGVPAAPLVLTTCAASANPAEAAERRARFPDAAAEDMEAFAVAAACALAGVALRVVRGISNAVGERDPARWRIPSALEAARARAIQVLESW